jgi:hypothetical protein
VSDKFNDNGNQYGRKLLAIEAGLQEFGEVLFLDWDCNFIKPMDQAFLDMLAEKETQIPLYVHNQPDPFDSSAELAPEIYISSNFGFFYSRNPQIATDIIDMATAEDMFGCVEEWSWNILSGLKNDLLAYTQKHLPRFGHGVSDTAIAPDHPNRNRQQAAWNWVEQRFNMDIYLEHT